MIQPDNIRFNVSLFCFILFEVHTISYLLKYVNTGIPVSRKDF